VASSSSSSYSSSGSNRHHPDVDVEGGVDETGESESKSEELLIVYAPPGKLGLILDSPDPGPAMVYKCKTWSPIRDMVRNGDRIVAVDDVDVRAMHAVRVSKLLSGTSHRTRKIAVVRYLP
jgi:hypothetical protein